jgi:hypothetical protein
MWTNESFSIAYQASGFLISDNVPGTMHNPLATRVCTGTASHGPCWVFRDRISDLHLIDLFDRIHTFRLWRHGLSNGPDKNLDASLAGVE